MNDDGKLRNGYDFGNDRNVGNVKNFRNVITDIKCHTFLKSQPRADLNDDGNFMKSGNFRNVRNDRNVENSGMSGHTSSVIPLQKHKLELKFK